MKPEATVLIWAKPALNPWNLKWIEMGIEMGGRVNEMQGFVGGNGEMVRIK